MEEGSLRSKIIYTISLNVSYFIYGIGANMLGLSLIDMANLLHVGLNQVSIGLSIKSFFFSVGSLVCMLSLNKFNRQFQVALSFMFLGISLTLIPISKNLNQCYLWEAVAGICSSAIEISCNVWMLEIWKEENHRHMQTLNFFLSLGTILAPIVTVPFLSSEDRVLKDLNLNETNLTRNGLVKSKLSAKYLDVLLAANFDNQTSPYDHHLATKSQIHIAYAIIGFITFVTGLMINLLYLFVPYDDENKRKEGFVFPPPKRPKESKFRLSSVYYWMVLVLCCAIFCFYHSITINNTGYIQAFGVESQLTSKTTGSYLTLCYSCVLTFACFCFVFISAKLRPILIILADLVLLVISNGILIFHCRSVEWLWASIVLLAIGMSSVYPSLYSHMKQRIEVGNNVAAVITFSSGLIAMFYPALNGYFIEAFPTTFPIINLVSVGIMIVLFCFLHIFDLIYNKKLRSELSIKKSSEEDSSQDAYKNTHL